MISPVQGVSCLNSPDLGSNNRTSIACDAIAGYAVACRMPAAQTVDAECGSNAIMTEDVLCPAQAEQTLDAGCEPNPTAGPCNV